jgi:hypothetical protein
MPDELAEYTFRLDDFGVVLNPNVSVPPFVDITDVVGLDSAEVRQTERDWEGNDGTFMDAEFEKGRGIVLTGTAYADPDGVELFMDQLKGNWAPSKTLVKFYFKGPGAVERMLLVKPLGLRYNWRTARRYGSTDIQFQCFAEDPRIYSSQEYSTSVNINTSGGVGFGFPFNFPFDFGTIVSGLGTNLFNEGNRDTPVVFSIPGPSTNPRIVNDSTGDEMAFTVTLQANETLVIDTKYKTVKLDGAFNRRSTLNFPTWFNLKPGTNIIRYLATSGAGGPMIATYRSAWR